MERIKVTSIFLLFFFLAKLRPPSVLHNRENWSSRLKLVQHIDASDCGTLATLATREVTAGALVDVPLVTSSRVGLHTVREPKGRLWEVGEESLVESL